MGVDVQRLHEFSQDSIESDTNRSGSFKKPMLKTNAINAKRRK